MKYSKPFWVTGLISGVILFLLILLPMLPRLRYSEYLGQGFLPSFRPRIKGNFSRLEKWENIQDFRRQLLASYCGPKRPIQEVLTNIQMEDFSASPSFLYQESFHVVNCNIHKVASTSIKIMMVNAMGDFPRRNLKDVTRLHHWKYVGRSLAAIGKLSPEKMQFVLETYPSFLFVRHPIDRLISAYNGKIISHGAQRMDDKIKQIKDFTKNSTNASELKKEVSFPEFVDWLVMEHDNNTHWRSFEDTCFPCHINYTYIGHVESLVKDAYYIMYKLYGEDIANNVMQNFPHLNRNDRASHVVAGKFMRQLTEQQRESLNKFVHNDAKAFGYEYYK